MKVTQVSSLSLVAIIILAVVFGGVVGIFVSRSQGVAPSAEVSNSQVPAEVVDLGCPSAPAKVTVATTVNEQLIGTGSYVQHQVMVDGEPVGSIEVSSPSIVEILRQTDCNAYLAVMPDGVGGYINYSIAPVAFYKLSLSEGALTKLETNGATVNDVSADETKIVGSILAEGMQGGVNIIYVTDVATGTAKPYSVPGDWGVAGDETFSPDGTKIAFAVALQNPDAEASQVMILDLVTGDFSVFSSRQENVIQHVDGWINNTTPRLR